MLVHCPVLCIAIVCIIYNHMQNLYHAKLNPLQRAHAFILKKEADMVQQKIKFQKTKPQTLQETISNPRSIRYSAKVRGFMHVSSLYINMGYYYIELSPGSKQICTIVIPWGNCEYQKLPMRVCNIPDIFQDKISEIFKGFDMARDRFQLNMTPFIHTLSFEGTKNGHAIISAKF